ncbi:penicillin-binding protein activator [Klebsiella sp. BIGb0407]|uniref:penicillin-binding protein activator n=1 Tax=Klebsiella sp. BIGb0407 TaxID=2940603 RepID=UPI002167A8D2|nr:penicillin-binding protein activator [Klebsiella sp. BIGb0407]MCS3433714.1 outer membrane PBP1 activator LpoA protein [Klebsiella sp. BIGb0407]
MRLSTLKLSKVGRSLPVLLAALIFAGCTSQTSDTPQELPPANGTASSAWYLQKIEQSSDDSKTQWQLLAIRALLQEGQTEQAIGIYNQLPEKLNNAQQLEQSLLMAQIKTAQQDYAAASALLNNIDATRLDANQQQAYYSAVIAASAGHPSLALVRAYIAQEPLLSNDKKQENIDGTWQAVSSMTPEQMNTLVINADENTLQGWLELQQIWTNNRTDLEKLKTGIQEWQIRYPNNPGAKLLPTQLTNLQNINVGSASIGKIALLLPLNGQAGLFGHSIQQGFEAARTQGSQPVASLEAPAESLASDDLSSLTGVIPAVDEQPQSAAVSSVPANPNAEIKIYDTSSQPIDQVLAQAQQDGATIVVGPLLKNDVDALSGVNSSLNILALNQPEATQNHPNICYFALSPEDEARDAAHHIWQQNQRSPLLLVPSSPLGERVAKAFTSEWQSLGGGTVLQQRLGSMSDLKRGINGGSGIALTGTPVITANNPPESVTIGDLTIPTVPVEPQITSSGGNVDAVYIVASSDEMALIKPMITMRTGSRGGAQLYASSRSAQGISGPDFRFEMEGLQYSEIPLLSGGNPQLMQQALTSVNNDYSLARLYAMGVDAWSLANHFAELRQSPGFTLNGNTGQLSATTDCVVNRKLNWLQFSQGQVVPVS